MPISLSAIRFYGIDSVMDFLIFLVAILVTYQSYNIYRLLKEKNYKFFSLAFLSISIAFLFKIVVNFTFFYQIEILQTYFINSALLVHLEFLDWVNFFSVIFYRIFLLIGFLILFLLFTKTERKEKIVLFVYLSIITVLFSVYFSFVFHLTLFLLISFLTIYFYRNYKRIKSRNSLIVFYSFLTILTANFVGFFSSLHPLFYLTYEVILLIGFFVLLANHLNLKKGIN
ncbi:MAG: hypothetical protein WC584_02425 [Candidatus Pacearchaeota archaeon]